MRANPKALSSALPSTATMPESTPLKCTPRRNLVVWAVSLFLVAILVIKSLSTSPNSHMLLTNASPLLKTATTSHTRALAAVSDVTASETVQQRSSSAAVGNKSNGKHQAVMSLYLNHASTGNSYYKLIPDCLDPSPPKDFLDIGRKAGSQKVMGNFELEECLEERSHCARPSQLKETCRTWSYYYDSIYNQWLQPKLAREDAKPFQVIEIGFFYGKGHKVLAEFLPRAELHSIEISCLPEGPREDGKWPWGNFASESSQYEELLSNKRLHCGDAYNYDFVQSIYKEHIHRPDAPPLQVVVEDGSALSIDMAASLFFWIPRLEPGGMFFVEGIRPNDKRSSHLGPSDQFKTHIIHML